MAQNQRQTPLDDQSIVAERDAKEAARLAAVTAVVPATSQDVLVIVKTPEHYGFRWRSHPLATDGGGTTLRLADTATEITDYERFKHAFGADRIKAWLNGASSLKVQEDTVCRKLREKNATVSEQEQREAVVRRVLLGIAGPRGGVKTITVEVTTYAALDGKQYATLLEAQAVSIGVMVDMGLTVEQAKQRLNIGS